MWDLWQLRSGVCSIRVTWRSQVCECGIGSVRCSFKVEFGPCKFVGLVDVSNGGVMWWQFIEAEDTAVRGGLIVWEMFEEEGLERESCM